MGADPVGKKHQEPQAHTEATTQGRTGHPPEERRGDREAGRGARGRRERGERGRGPEGGGKGKVARLQVEYSVTHNGLLGARTPRALSCVSVNQQEPAGRVEPKRGVIQSFPSIRRTAIAPD